MPKNQDTTPVETSNNKNYESMKLDPAFEERWAPVHVLTSTTSPLGWADRGIPLPSLNAAYEAWIESIDNNNK